MTIYVFLTNNVVTDIARVKPHNIFQPAYADQFIEAPDEVTHGWTYADGVFSAPQVVEPPDAYKYKRAAEYPPMADYLDGIVKGDQAQVQAYIDACLAVKAKYPKPE